MSLLAVGPTKLLLLTPLNFFPHMSYHIFPYCCMSLPLLSLHHLHHPSQDLPASSYHSSQDITHQVHPHLAFLHLLHGPVGVSSSLITPGMRILGQARVPHDSTTPTLRSSNQLFISPTSAMLNHSAHCWSPGWSVVKGVQLCCASSTLRSTNKTLRSTDKTLRSTDHSGALTRH